MSRWILRGLKKGIITSRFPKGKPEIISPWSTLPVYNAGTYEGCPTDAIHKNEVDLRKCISCGRCSPGFMPSLNESNSIILNSQKSLRKSLKIYVLDSGSCGACNSELHALGNPYYDMNRLGIFFVNTPKQADAIFVIGVLSERMKEVVKEAYDVMAEPKLVFAMGACPASGSILGKSLSGILDADVIIGGCPPDPFVILDAIIKARGEV